MLLKFAHKEINEFAQGVKVFENTGEPFEVSEMLGNDLLKAKIKLGGETVSVFKRFEQKVSKSMLPEDFPMRDELETNGFLTLADLADLKLESHKDLQGIGKTTMQRILDARDKLVNEGEE